MSGHQCPTNPTSTTYFFPEERLAEARLKPHVVVSFNKRDTQSRRDKLLYSTRASSAVLTYCCAASPTTSPSCTSSSSSAPSACTCPIGARRTATRFLTITHNPLTMSRMDRLFGVTMRERGVSQLVSVDLRAAEALQAA